MPIRDDERHLTKDGGLMMTGPSYYLLCRMADPGETVTLIDREYGAAQSMIDGQSVMRFVVENQRGERYVVEPWQLSRVPPDELYRQLRGQRFPITRLPVETIRLTA